MSDLAAELKFAFRTLSRSPWFAALAVLTLCLGIGATTALFSLVDSVLLRPLPYKDPHRLVEIWGQNEERAGMRVPGPILEALREKSTTLDEIAIHGPVSGVMRAPDGALDLRGDRVSANFFDVLGVQPLLGRGFLPDDEAAGAPPVMVVSFGFWQQRFGGDPSAIGRTVYLDALPYTVVGVMPPEFRTSFDPITHDYWTPHVNDRTRDLERESGYELVARLSRGVSVDAARREVQAIAAGVAVSGWGVGGRRLGLIPLKHDIVRDRAYALQLLMAAVAVVLAVACANLAQLLLARSDQRVREFATRKAIGATSAQLFRLALLESLLLSAAGGVGGIAFAYWLVPAMLALAPSAIPRLAEATIDAGARRGGWVECAERLRLWIGACSASRAAVRRAGDEAHVERCCARKSRLPLRAGCRPSGRVSDSDCARGTRWTDVPHAVAVEPGVRKQLPDRLLVGSATAAFCESGRSAAAP